MKKFCLTGMVMIALGLFLVLPASAADVTVGTDINSAYVWRGITFNDGLVFQPSLDVGYKGFGLNVWGNLDIGDYDDTLDKGDFSEVDFTLSYGFDVDRFSFGVGFIEYMFPAGAEGTREIYGTVNVDIYKGIYAGLGLYYDVEAIGDYYANASIGYATSITKKLGIDVSALAGYASDDWATANTGTDGGLHEYTLSASGTYTVIENLDVSVYLNYTDSLDEDVLADQDVDIYGGIGIYYAF